LNFGTSQHDYANDVLNSKRAVTPARALKIERVLGYPARLLLAMPLLCIIGTQIYGKPVWLIHGCRRGMKPSLSRAIASDQT
jgi:hypothetical protein